MPHGVRPVSLHVSDRVGKGFRKSRVPKKYLTSSHAGVVAPTKQAARGDYQCNLPMSVHSRYINKVKAARAAGASAAGTATTTATDATAAATGDDGKKKKKERPKPATNKVFAIPGTPHEFNPDQPETLPDTAHDLAYQLLSHVVQTPGPEGIVNPWKDSKNPAQFFGIDDAVFDSVSVSPQGFLGLKLKNKYISKRLVPFLVQNDAPPLLLYESDMGYVTPQAAEDCVYDDRALSLVQNDQNDDIDGATNSPTTLNKKHQKQPIPLPAYPRVVTIDYASPNIAKEMHVGHIRTTAIGDMLSRVLEFSGNTLQRYNHLGDWGTQFGMLLCHYNDLIQKGEIQADDIKKLTTADLLKFYQTAKKRFDDEPDFQPRAKSYVVRLQGGDQECLTIWKDFCNISMKSFQGIFTRLQLDPRLLERGESFYQPFLNDVIDELLTNNVAIERDGAVLLPPASYWEELENPKQNDQTDSTPDDNGAAAASDDASDKKKKTDASAKKTDADKTAGGDNDDEEDGADEDSVDNTLIPGAVVLRKSDGGFTYGATDMAAIRLRLLGTKSWYNQAKNQPAWFATDMRYKGDDVDSLPTDWALYCVDSGQSIHFQRIFEAANRVGWVNRGKKLAQERKVEYFNDILTNLIQDNTHTTAQQQQNTPTTTNNIKKLVKIQPTNIDGDGTAFQADDVVQIGQEQQQKINSSDQQQEQQQQQNDVSILDNPDLRIEHVDFGVVCGADGKRLRTRAGVQIKLTDLLDESVSRSRVIIDGIVEKNIANANAAAANPNENNTPVNDLKQQRHQLLQQEHVKQQLSEAVGYGSIKYSDLSKNRTSDYVFNFDTMLDMQGDTAGYLLYAHARLFSMLQRCGVTHQRYVNNVERLLKKDDPTGVYKQLVEYDYQHLTSTKSNTNQQYDSLFDFIIRNPVVMEDMLLSDDNTALSDPQQNKLNTYHKLLVSATLAQYNSPYVADNSSIFYKRRKINNNNIWSKTGNIVDGVEETRVDQDYLESLTHNVMTLDRDYGISLSAPTQNDKTTNKNNKNNNAYSEIPLIALDHPSERQLALHIAQFHDAMAGTLNSLGPHVMCDYTLALSSAFSAFYRDCPVVMAAEEQIQNVKINPRPVGDAEYFNTQDSRVLLTHATTVTLERCLDLIGIQPTKFM